MEQSSHNIGEIHLEDEHGKIWLMRANVFGCDKIFCTRDALEKSSFASGAKIYYQNTVVGELISKQYNKLDGFLVVFFKLTVNRDYLPNIDCLYAIPRYNASQIQCVCCQRIFKIGSEACECIESAPAIQIPQLHISGVNIINGLREDIATFDSRQNLLLKHFGGIISTIQINEEFESE